MHFVEHYDEVFQIAFPSKGDSKWRCLASPSSMVNRLQEEGSSPRSTRK